MTTLARRFLRSSAAIVALGLVIPTACTTSRRDYGDPDPDGSAGASSGGAESSGGAATGGAASGGAPAGGGGGSSGETGGQGGEMNVEVEPTSCTKDEDCLSGSCRLSYRDKDGDGYGTNDDVTGRCDGTIPAGYTAFGGDCCDDGGNLELAALIHPGQTEYFDSPANICGIAWDYDCNGQLGFGGYTCSNTNDGEACANPEMRNYETSSAKATTRPTGCAANGLSCDTGCMSQSVDLQESDCGSHYALIGCACINSSCSTTGGGTRRVVQCR